MRVTASRFSPLHSATALALLLIYGMTTAGCAAPRRDDTASGVTISGEFLADGSCRVLVNGAALFAATDHPRTTHDAGAVADLAPAGYALHQLTCVPSDAGSARGPDASATNDMTNERMLIVALYAREGAPLHVGSYSVREALATPDDTANVAARAGVAVFGVPPGSHEATESGNAHHAGVRYLEGRGGTLTIASVSRDADGQHVIGTFSVRASPAWSM